MICVFDCETIPDVELLKHKGYEGSGLEISQAAVQDQAEKSGSGFLPILYHQVVTISAVIADEYGSFQKVNTINGSDEREMIENFLNFINKHNPKLVSFNGRGFDLPMLMVRAMKYNLTCPAYFEVDNRELNKSKWDNYRYRFSNRFHVDLLDHISEFGAVRGLKLDDLCMMVGIVGKYDVSGDQVMELYYHNEHQKISEYCESDVLNTYWLFLKYELLKGNITMEDYYSHLGAMHDKLPRDKSYSDIFIAAVKEEANPV
jgi:predicted PolB exonuclease-like 3'-5' exonuclease